MYKMKQINMESAVYKASKMMMLAAIIGSLVTMTSVSVNAQKTAHGANKKKPNIIIIFTDDHGTTDLGLHGIDPNVDTPNLDKLAAGGALMKAGYASSPKCVPSRAGIMMGRIQNEVGLVINNDGPLELYDLDGKPIVLLPQYMKELGYRTGHVGKWALGVAPGKRGFDDYYDGVLENYTVNFDLNGKSVPQQKVTDMRNRVTVQGEAAAAFIEKNHDKPFFLYLPLYAPHLPRISKDDPYYLNFPKLDYPNYSDELDDIRRQGLALVKAIDDTVGVVMEKLRQHGIEENTLVFFTSDNGGSPKFGKGQDSKSQLATSDGSENIPLRGEKGTLWEGGIRVPMLAYWKGSIPGGLVIEEPVWTLDLTTTSIIAGGGTPSPEMDGVDLLPRLINGATSVKRDKPLYWDHKPSIAIRKGDWKLQRDGTQDYLFNLAEDPFELVNLRYQNPEKHAELYKDLMAWRETLPVEGRSRLGNPYGPAYVDGAGVGVGIDSRYKIPYQDAKAAAYPAMIQTPNAPKNLEINKVVVNPEELTDQEKKRAAKAAKKRKKRAKRAEAESI